MWAISDQEFEDQVYSLFYPKYPRYPQIYECSNCGRLALFSQASDTEPVFWFKQEKIVGQHKVNSIRTLLQPLRDL